MNTMRSVALALMIVLAGAPAARAGAWLREKGSGFASSTITVNRENEEYIKSYEASGSVYLEYGLTENLTLGLDASYGYELTGEQEGSGIVFLRFPLGPTDRDNKFAAHVGLGTRYLANYMGGSFLPAAEVGLSWGRGIKVADRWGWVNLDTSVNKPRAPAQQRFKIDATIGLGLSNKIKVMFQVFNTFQGGDTYTHIVPSLLMSPDEGRTTFQISVEVPTFNGEKPGLKLGIWRQF
jgi:hypothetical protein